MRPTCLHFFSKMMAAIPLSDLPLGTAERFWALVIKGEPDECWGWNGPVKKKGYGQFRIGKHRVAAHRVAYALTYGDPGIENDVDHTCRARDCPNPRHLESVVPIENRRRRIEAHRMMRTEVP